MIQKPPRGGDYDIGAIPKRLLLGDHADAAVDGSGRKASVTGQPLEVVQDLEGQLTGGGQDQRTRRASGEGQQLVQDGQEEGRGLAASRDRVGQEVPAFEGMGDTSRLDGGGAYEAQILDASKEGRVQLEGRKSQNYVRFLGAQQAGRNIRLDRLAQSL